MTTTPVTIEQAAAIVGVSVSTICRRIRAGALRVEETRRPQGVVWLVHLPPGTTVDAATATVDTAPVVTTATAAQPAGDAIATMIQATLTPIVAPLVTELAASRQAMERQADTIREQAETIGQLRAELAAARAPERPQEARGTASTSEATRGSHRSPCRRPGGGAGERRSRSAPCWC